MTMLIGLTGGIGSGKSVVSRILRVRGFEVYDCDTEARRLMEASEPLVRELKCRWGDDIYDRSGRLDRRRVAAIVFADDTERAWLDALVHGLVRADVDAWVRKVRAAGDGPQCDSRQSGRQLFVESAILCTSGLAPMCREVWEVTAPVAVRLKRLEVRSGLCEADAIARIDAQRNEVEALHKLHGLKRIVNHGTVPVLFQIDELLMGIDRAAAGPAIDGNKNTQVT